MTSSNEDKSPILSAMNESHHPRKRSKVSRACDSCRKKKIRCNGEYSSTLQKVTRTCNNCVKNNESCTFSRIPLKRGPSKGYIRDLEEKLENKPRKTSVDQQAQQPLPFPQNHLNRNTNAHGQTSTSPPIILPPLVGYQSKLNILPPAVQKINNNSNLSNPSSPGSSMFNGILNPNGEIPKPKTQRPRSNSQKTHSPPIQGPFWKVPYEMPDSNISSSIRRSSVDSVSSTSTNGSRSSRLPSLKPSFSLTSENGLISDSESDEFYSVKSSRRQSTQSLSPRNSVTSLSSLNGRINKSLSFQSQHVPISLQQQPSQPFQFQFPNPHYPLPPQPVYVPIQYSKIPLNSIENNLKLYYSKYHLNFPILPFNENFLIQLVDNSDESNKLLIELFNLSLNNLNNFKSLNLNDNILILSRILSLYPFNNFGIKLNDNLLIIFFSSLLIINYAILLNGDIYSLGISMTMAIFNDFKILENFIDLTKRKESSPKDLDNIKLYLPKLYYCLSIIDNIYCLSFGIQKNISNNLTEVLHKNLDLLVPINSVNSGILNFKNSMILNDLILMRDNFILNNTQVQLTKLVTNWNHSIVQNTVFSNYFISLINDKYELINYLIEISKFLNNQQHGEGDEEEFSEILNDYHLKLIRLIKKLSSSIINFSNFISTSSNSNELINPYLNISFGQLFKLIKLSKLIIDSLINFINSKNVEFLNRCIKINNDLSISFNLLNLNLNNVNLGSTSVNLIKNKIEFYKLNFNLPSIDQNKNARDNVNIKHNLNLWKRDFWNIILPFVEKENIDGWY